MSNLANYAKLEFMALDITGKNYLSWMLDAEIHLNAHGLEDTIKEQNETSNQNKARSMIFLRRHLHDDLKVEYLTVKDPLVLWNSLKERYDHQKMIVLPKARYEWMHLRLQDFKSVSEYNSAVFRITSQLRLCGENITDYDMLEKTFTTFHASNMLLQQQYRGKCFEKYSELISCLLVAEQNNELLLKNHESRPTGSNPFPEVNVVNYENFKGRGRGRKGGYNRGRGRGRGRGRYHGPNRGGSNSRPKGGRIEKNPRRETSGNNKHSENACYRCGGKGHWSRTCRTPRHLVDLYKESLKNNGKGLRTEVNHVDMAENSEYNDNDVNYMEAADFLE
jgi:gag-polypeptide of LTR copia-type/Zinc knuckle